MTNEIKTPQDILDYINDRVIPNEYWDKVLDYITNLQEENEQLTKARYSLDRVELEQRINKAIELIDEPIYYVTDNMETPKIFIRRLKEVKDILQGEDNDNKRY